MISVTITHTNGETTAYRFALVEGVRYRIGRDTSCEISLPDEEYLSRVHCFILYSNGQLMIQDNQSSNGVFLDDQRITSDFLVMNQPYRIGYCYMTVQEDDTPDEQEVPYQAPPAYSDGARKISHLKVFMGIHRSDEKARTRGNAKRRDRNDI